MPSAAVMAVLVVAATLPSKSARGQVVQGVRLDWNIGPCKLQVFEPCEHAAVTTYLFTRDHRYRLDPKDPRPPEHFDPGVPTKVIVHGYTGDVDYNVTAAIRDAYLAQGGCNVLAVDWGELSNFPCYASAVLHTWVAGRCLAETLLALRRSTPGFQLAAVHAVGFSLGAHVAAFASNGARDALGRPFGRVTGLDPALPFFATLKNTWKLDKSDADFVDVIHTNVGVFGKIEPTGHADFYVNGGSLQPACANHSTTCTRRSTSPSRCGRRASGAPPAPATTSTRRAGAPTQRPTGSSACPWANPAGPGLLECISLRPTTNHRSRWTGDDFCSHRYFSRIW
ncbi:putative endothelial lipase [Bacillus rossius redtenbacheri]|uniref:putative endothelial lipase n=1 Tax=Bacillus rossius redtenbacheri TaxID=93214 RepID=UPI002FDD19DA